MELFSDVDALRAVFSRAEDEKVVAAARIDEARKEAESVKAELAKVQQERDTLKAELEDLRKVPEKQEAALVPEVVIADEPPPKPASSFSHTGNGASPLGGIFGGNISSLADLERQAQAELARMRASGGKGFFGFGKKK